MSWARFESLFAGTSEENRRIKLKKMKVSVKYLQLLMKSQLLKKMVDFRHYFL